MVLSDVLAVLFGIALGVMMSIPVSLVIALATHKPGLQARDMGATWQSETVIDVPSREIMVL